VKAEGSVNRRIGNGSSMAEWKEMVDPIKGKNPENKVGRLADLRISTAARHAVRRRIGPGRRNLAIRIERRSGACGWVSFGLMMDEPSDEDYACRCGGVRWVVEHALFEQVGPITVDYAPEGEGERFAITSERGLSATCLGCPTRCRNNLGEVEGE